MRITIHQPEHLPWTGFFHKMALADRYVLLDNVQFTKNNWQNRNRVLGQNGTPEWLTVPVETKGHTDSTICEMRIDNSRNWQAKYWGRLCDSYRRHPFFARYADQLEAIIRKQRDLLADLNIELIEFFRAVLGIKTPLARATELGVQGSKSELLLDICLKSGSDCYLSGPSGRDYLDTALFTSKGVRVEYHSFKPPVYPARTFVPGLSTLDLVMNCGPESRQVLGLGGLD